MSELAVSMTQIVDRATKRAQAENWAAGVANVYSLNGQLVWQLPDGTITSEEPV